MGKIRTTNKRRQRIERRKWHSFSALCQIADRFGEVPAIWHRDKLYHLGAFKFASRYNIARSK